MTKGPRRVVLSALLAVATVHCGSVRETVDVVQLSLVARPASCVEANASTDVQALLDDPANAAICLAPGRYRGPWVISRSVQLWGSREAVVGAPGGTIIDVRAPGAAVLGLTVDGTGARFDKLDGAIRVTANDVRVEGVTVVNAVFGILVEGARRAAILGNYIQGSRDPALGLRGDTIRIWATHDSRVEDNVMYDGRDMVVWYSNNNAIVRNRVDGGRYGIHFMYSHNNRGTGAAARSADPRRADSESGCRFAQPVFRRSSRSLRWRDPDPVFASARGDPYARRSRDRSRRRSADLSRSGA